MSLLNCILPFKTVQWSPHGTTAEYLVEGIPSGESFSHLSGPCDRTEEQRLRSSCPALFCHRDDFFPLSHWRVNDILERQLILLYGVVSTWVQLAYLLAGLNRFWSAAQRAEGHFGEGEIGRSSTVQKRSQTSVGLHHFKNTRSAIAQPVTLLRVIYLAWPPLSSPYHRFW